MFSPGLYTEGFNGTDASFGIEDHYPSSAFGDDLFWASTWLYRASINSIRNFNQSYYGEAMSTTMSLACALPACCFPLTMHVVCCVAVCACKACAGTRTAAGISAQRVQVRRA